MTAVLRPSALEETSLVLNAETVLPIAYLMQLGPAYGLLGMSVSTAKAVDVINAIPNARPETRQIIVYTLFVWRVLPRLAAGRDL